MKRASSYSFVVTFVWVGFVAAISFMEAPVKFTAPSLSLEVGLDVGRTVFSALNKIELGFAVLIIISFFISSVEKKIILTFSFIFIILLMQTFWLLPSLNERAAVIISGGVPPDSSDHILYIILELIKIIMLVLLGLFQINNFKKIVIRESLI